MGAVGAIMPLICISPLWASTLLGWGIDHFAYLLLASNVFTMVFMCLTFQPLQLKLGLAPCGMLGCIALALSHLIWIQVDTNGATDYMLLVLSMVLFAGSGMSCSVVNPLLAQLARKETMGSILAIGAIANSVGR